LSYRERAAKWLRRHPRLTSSVAVAVVAACVLAGAGVAVSVLRDRLAVTQESLLDAQSRPLDEERVYRLACNDYMAEGGDDLVTLTRGRSRIDTTISLREALEEDIRERSASGPFRYEGDGRVARESGSPLPARGD